MGICRPNRGRRFGFCVFFSHCDLMGHLFQMLLICIYVFHILRRVHRISKPTKDGIQSSDKDGATPERSQIAPVGPLTPSTDKP